MKADCWRLNANEVNAVERDDELICYLWLAEKKDGVIRYLTLTRSHGANDLYIERDDQAWSCYGGILKVQLSSAGMKVYLDPNGTSHLGGVTCLNVRFGAEVTSSYDIIEKVLRILLPEGLLSVE